MITKTFALSSLLLCFLFSQCQTTKQNEKHNYVFQNDSLALSWKTFKQESAKHQNSYSYTCSFVSWVGFGSNTTLTVKNGKVVKRSYEEFETNETNGKRQTTKSWTEKENELGKHDRGAPIRTMEEIYQEGDKFMDVNAEENYIYFEVDKNGILTLAGHVPKNCSDDCFEGISLSHFEWL